MKKIYLILSVIGFILPNIFVALESIESGNILLWYNIPETFRAMFINYISSAFVVDLLVVVLIFFVWSYHEAKKFKIKNLWLIWVLTMAFGLSFTFPFFLYLREGKIKI
ncbi:DUF2834 domain-containing protein [Flexithrix dorotheae]|uniref:DUF2834 domain-containing protein n=1 Tax=Flexithrix dorotheae TaxID=70993 RepID=UPI00035FFEF0|nr:DUF2834 domain-containing protein [Flexithrix dorotheae]